MSRGEALHAPPHALDRVLSVEIVLIVVIPRAVDFDCEPRRGIGEVDPGENGAVGPPNPPLSRWNGQCLTTHELLELSFQDAPGDRLTDAEADRSADAAAASPAVSPALELGLEDVQRQEPTPKGVIEGGEQRRFVDDGSEVDDRAQRPRDGHALEHRRLALVESDRLVPDHV